MIAQFAPGDIEPNTILSEDVTHLESRFNDIQKAREWIPARLDQIENGDHEVIL